MERTSFGYSTKNIPTAPKTSYLKTFIRKTELFLKRVRCRVHFYLNPQSKDAEHENYGFKSNKFPPTVNELKDFEMEMANLIQKIEFGNKSNAFQRKLAKDMKSIKKKGKMMVKADKTANYYALSSQHYADLTHNNVMETYKSTQSETNDIDNEKRLIADGINFSNRVEKLAEKDVFITLKDTNLIFKNAPTCRLINATRSELGQVSKRILERIIKNTVNATGVNLWKSTKDVLTWFQNIPVTRRTRLINFDIIDFYPSITENLLNKAIKHAKQYTEITNSEIDIIMHTKRTLVFNNGKPWKKKDNGSGFDVTMGSLDGAETCELVLCYMLSLLQQRYGNSFGLYRDDGLGTSALSP